MTPASWFIFTLILAAGFLGMRSWLKRRGSCQCGSCPPTCRCTFSSLTPPAHQSGENPRRVDLG